jgi:signal transduction histidine kinase
LEKLGNIKNQFLMTIQHHLRTPLTSMRGYTDLLLGGNKESTTN